MTASSESGSTSLSVTSLAARPGKVGDGLELRRLGVCRGQAATGQAPQHVGPTLPGYGRHRGAHPLRGSTLTVSPVLLSASTPWIRRLVGLAQPTSPASVLHCVAGRCNAAARRRAASPAVSKACFRLRAHAHESV